MKNNFKMDVRKNNYNQGVSKKAYSSPRLFDYGDIRELTETVGMGSVNDGMPVKSH